MDVGFQICLYTHNVRSFGYKTHVFSWSLLVYPVADVYMVHTGECAFMIVYGCWLLYIVKYCNCSPHHYWFVVF